MKFALWIRSEVETPWREVYDKPVGRQHEQWDRFHPANRLRGKTLAAVEEWGRALVDWFNATRRPGERQREFVSAEILDS